MLHKPVLIKEVLRYLDPKPNENFVDCTVGQGGHAKLILEKTNPDGKVLAIDWDEGQIENSKSVLAQFGQRIIFENNSYANLNEILKRLQFKKISGILLDLGYSSWQMEQAGKGFSFLSDEPLDMRYSHQNNLTAKKIINDYSVYELEKIIREFSQERFARQIAREIESHRIKKPIETTQELKSIIEKVVYQKGKISPATRTFQALRIAVNGELENLKSFLPQAIENLESKARLAVISFHSLEDKIVKDFFRQKEKEGMVKILTKKPIEAESEELARNPRARSAKLRVIIKN